MLGSFGELLGAVCEFAEEAFRKEFWGLLRNLWEASGKFLGNRLEPFKDVGPLKPLK